jgi:ABC-type glycerol-3-phosphate transport system substrate-binding protein
MKQHLMGMAGILFRLIVMLVLILGQTACSKVSQPVSTPVTSSDKVVITFADYEVSRSRYEPLMAEFHKQNPGITVQFVPIPMSSFGSNETQSDHYRTQASAADTSLAFTGGPEVSAYFRDLGPQMEADSSFKPDDFWPGALTACQDQKGHTWGIPVSLTLTGIFYDEQAFTAAGLAVPKPGWTWDDFRRDIPTLAGHEGDTVHYGYADPPFSTESLLTPLINASLATNGGEIDVQALTNVSQWYLDLAKARVLYPITDIENIKQREADWTTLFNTSKPPAMWAGHLDYPVPGKMGGNSFALDQYGFAPFPVAADGSASLTSPLLAQCVVVSANSLHPSATWAWANFLSQQTLIRDKTKLNELALLPARQSVADAADLWNSLPAKAQSAVHYAVEHGSYLGLYLSIDQTVDIAIEKATSGKANLSAALADAKTGLTYTPQPQPATKGTEIAVATPVPSQAMTANIPIISFFPGNQTPEVVKALEALANQFNKEHQDILVKISDEQSGNHDCFIDRTGSVYLIQSGNVIDLSALMDNEPASFQQDYDPSLLAASHYQGKLYDLPVTTQPTVMSYNADLLAKRGLQPPSPDWNFNDFLTLIQKVASTTETDKSYGYFNPDFDLLIAQRNVQWLDITSGNIPVVKLNTPEMANALTWLTGLIKTGALYSDNSSGDWWQNLSNTFTSGQAAFWTSQAGLTDGTVFINTVGDKPAFKVGVVPLPAMQVSIPTFRWSDDWGTYISNQAKDPQACWSWMKFLSEQASVLPGIPARKSVATSPAWEASVGKDLSNTYRLAAARAYHDTNGVLNLNDVILIGPLQTWEGQAQNAIIRGDNPKIALSGAQKKADQYLACIQGADIARLNYKDLTDKVKSCATQADPQGSW